MTADLEKVATSRETLLATNQVGCSMWCTDCRQDVPGVTLSGEPARASGGTETILCVRCGHELTLSSALDTVPSQTSSGPDPTCRRLERTATLIRDSLEFDSWEMDDDLEQARVSTRAFPPKSLPSPPIPTTVTVVDDQLPRRQPRATLTWLHWLPVFASMSVLAFGSVLCGWSWVAQRDDLWRVGLPALLVGQVVLVMGLLLPLERIWRSDRQTRALLRVINEQVAELQS